MRLRDQRKESLLINSARVSLFIVARIAHRSTYTRDNSKSYSKQACVAQNLCASRWLNVRNSEE